MKIFSAHLNQFTMTIASIVIIGQGALADKSGVLNNEHLDSGVISAAFNLRAEDGGVISQLPKSAIDEGNLSLLPPEENADHSLCGAPLNIDVYLKITDIVVRMADYAVKGIPAQLSDADKEIIKKTPHCDPYKETLSSVADFLAIGTKPEQDSLDTISLTSTNNLQIKTKAGRNVNFAISQLPRHLDHISDLTGMVINADSSGQLLSVKVSFDSSNRDETPTQTTRTESCSFTYTRQVCEQWGRCRTETISEPGVRYVTTTTKFDLDYYQVSLINQQNISVYTAKIADGSFTTSTDNTSACMRQ